MWKGSKMTLEQLQEILPYSRQRAKVYYPHLVEAAAEFGIDSKLRLAAWLAQIGHESGQLLYTRELASGAAYDNRADLGNTNPAAIAIAKAHGTTPGRYFRGRGLIQTTGYNNYVLTMMKLGIDCVEHPELLEEPVNACRSAGLFWQINGLNKLADIGDIDGVSDKVNKGRKTKAYGDTNGWADRLEIYNRAMMILPE